MLTEGNQLKSPFIIHIREMANAVFHQEFKNHTMICYLLETKVYGLIYYRTVMMNNQNDSTINNTRMGFMYLQHTDILILILTDIHWKVDNTRKHAFYL